MYICEAILNQFLGYRIPWPKPREFTRLSKLWIIWTGMVRYVCIPLNLFIFNFFGRYAYIFDIVFGCVTCSWSHIVRLWGLYWDYQYWNIIKEKKLNGYGWSVRRGIQHLLSFPAAYNILFFKHVVKLMIKIGTKASYVVPLHIRLLTVWGSL
jgi:hypothetical protein